MKFYNSIGPNPRVVRMFMAEKGLNVPTQDVDLMAGDNRKPDHLARNPHGQMPALELDNGTYVCEITAICEYLEDTNPKPALIGATAEEKAETRMWTRRVDLNIVEPLTNGFRFSQGLRLFQNRIVCRARGGGRAQENRPGQADVARRSACRAGIPLRQTVHACRHLAVLLPRFRRPGRPAAQRREQECVGLVRAREGTTLNRGLSRVPKLSIRVRRAGGCTGVMPNMRHAGDGAGFR